MLGLDLIYKILRWVLGAVFIYAGGSKILEPQIFATLIEAYGIVPERLLIPVAIILPILEIIAGAGLMLDIQGSLSVITGLLIMFIVVLSYGIWIGLDVDCGCFGLDDPEAKAFHNLRISLYRDLGMLSGVIFIYSWRRYRAVSTVKMMFILNKLIKKGSVNDAYI